MKRYHDPTAWNKRVEKGDKETELQESKAVKSPGRQRKGTGQTAGGWRSSQPKEPCINEGLEVGRLLLLLASSFLPLARGMGGGGRAGEQAAPR